MKASASINNTQSPNDNIHETPCDACHSKTIYSDRYKCLQCENYNLCGICFEEDSFSKQHLTGHPMAHFKIPCELFGKSIRDSDVTLNQMKQRFAGQHHNIICNECQMKIVGMRFKCDKCYDYNMCSNCLDYRITNEKHSILHQVILMGIENLMKINMNDIRLNKLLGHGAFGQVHQGTWLSKDRPVACKITTINKRNRHLAEVFRQELATYNELSGIFILKMFGFCERQFDSEMKELCLIMEYMNRGSLRDVIESSNEEISLRRKLSMAYHIAIGMNKLHSHQIIHRDIRPDNILVSINYTAKIGDMGITKIFNPSERHTLAGCIPFMPPEFYSGRYDQSLDVFTYGLTLNELFTETCHHFNDQERMVVLTAKSPVLYELIIQCVARHPQERPLAMEIVSIIKLFNLSLNQHIGERHPNYKDLRIKNKNDIVSTFYDQCQIKVKREMQSNRFPLPSSYSLKELANQYFIDFIEEFNNFKRIKLQSGLSTKLSDRFMRLKKYCKLHHNIDRENDENHNATKHKHFHGIFERLQEKHENCFFVNNQLPICDIQSHAYDIFNRIKNFPTTFNR